MIFRILYQDQYLVAIDKPAGFHVHPPEDQHHRIANSVNCLYLLRNQLAGSYLYPVHRIDRATSGVLLFALDPETARLLCELFRTQQVRKTYFCVSRGWVNTQDTIDYPLTTDAVTEFQRVATSTVLQPVGIYPSGRYSLVRVEPQTGKYHQIRRHFAHISHPLIGDALYGDSPHNRLFRENLKIQGLLLKAYSIEFIHPHTQVLLKITSRWNTVWHRLFDLFGTCPWETRPQAISRKTCESA